MKHKLSSRITTSVPALLLMMLVSDISIAEPLPALDCLVEPNVIVDVGSPEHGIVESISVDRSDTVAAKDILVKLESSEQASTVRKARARANMRAEIEAREASLALAERKQQRMRDLFASEAISSHQRDEVETELKMAQMQLQQARDAVSLARIELDRARGDLNRRTIRSPISGVVVERFVAPGEYVNEKPLLRVAQMHPLRVETIAPAALFGKIKPGMRAVVTAESQGGQTFDAEVTIVDRMIDPASGTFGIRLELPNPDYAIPSGLNCRLQIDPMSRKAAVVEAAAPEKQSAQKAKVAALAAPGIKSAQKAAAPTPAVPVKKAAQTSPAPTPAATKTKPAQLATTKPNSTPATLPARECKSFGPFSNETQVNALMATLGNDAREIERREERDQIETGYVVLSQGKKGPSESLALANAMKERGVKDLAVLRFPPHKGHVSLGVFGKKRNATARAKQLADLGFAVEIVPNRVESVQFWADVEVTAKTLKQESWKRLAPDTITRACPPSAYVMADAVRSLKKPR